MSDVSFGEVLFRRRQELGVSIQQASRTLKLREDLLYALESEDYDHIPQSGFSRGIVDSYARYLGLDPKFVLRLFNYGLNHYQISQSKVYADSANLKNNLPSYRSSAVANAHISADRTTVHKQKRLAGFKSISDEISAESGADTTLSYPAGRGQSSLRKRPSASTNTASSAAARRRTSNSVDAGSDDTTPLTRGRSPQRERVGSRVRTIERGGKRNFDGKPTSSRRSGSFDYPASTSSGSRISGLLRSPVLLVLVTVIITAAVVLCVVSCVRGTSQDDQGSVVVNTQVSSPDITEPDENLTGDESGSAGSANAADSEAGDLAESGEDGESDDVTTGDDGTDGSSADTTAEVQETVVEVSVAQGGYTYLEIECDSQRYYGYSVSGPLTETYTVYDSITITVGDPTYVTVSKNGSIQEFISKASGVSCISLEGTPKADETTDDTAEASSEDR